MNGKGKRFLRFVGAMKIARNVAVFGRLGEWCSRPRLPQGGSWHARKGVTEGVSFVGCFGPMVYLQIFIGSEIFERLRSS